MSAGAGGFVRTGKVLSALALCVGLPVTAALAQDTDTRSRTGLRLGPVHVAPMLELRDIGLDTNVYKENRDEPIKDFAFTIVPTFTGTIEGRRANLAVRTATDFVYYAKQQSERSVNEDLSVTTRVSLNRVEPYGEAGYLNTRQRMTEEIDARARRVEWRAATGVRVRLTPKLSTVVSGQVWQMAFDADSVFDDHDLARELNRRTAGLQAGVRYTVTPLTSVSVSTDVSQVRFSEAAIRDAEVYQTGIAVELHPRALIAGTARLGYQHFKPMNAMLPEFMGLSGAASVAYRLRESTSIGFQFGRATDFSYLADEPYYLREVYGLSVRRQLTSAWDVEIGGMRTWHRYRRLTIGGKGRAPGHTDRLFGGSLLVGRHVGRGTRVTAGVSYQDRASEFSDRRFRGFRAATSAVFGF
jgi:hypothetical protein